MTDGKVSVTVTDGAIGAASVVVSNVTVVCVSPSAGAVVVPEMVGRVKVSAVERPPPPPLPQPAIASATATPSNPATA